MPNLDHLSYSSVQTYLMCPESWRRRYILQEKAPTATALVFGSAVHSAIESYLRSGRALDETWRESWSKQLAQEPEIAWGEDSADSIQADGERMLTAPTVATFLAEIKGAYDPARERSMERKVELRVPGVPVPIVGYIDIITKDGVPGDFKTAARMWAPDKAAQEMQPLVYLAALNQEGVHDHGWRFRHYVISKGARPSCKVFECQRSAAEVLTGLFPTIAQVWRDIQAERFPKVTSGWKCSEKYCEHWKGCQGAA